MTVERRLASKVVRPTTAACCPNQLIPIRPRDTQLRCEASGQLWEQNSDKLPFAATQAFPKTTAFGKRRAQS